MKWTLSLINCTNDPMLRLIGFLVCPFEDACSIIAVLRSYVTLKLDKKWQPREIAFTYIYIYTLQTQHTGYQTLENKISI